MGIKTDFKFLKKMAHNRQTIANLKKIEANWVKVRKEGKIIKSKKPLLLKLGKLVFWLKENASSSTIDMYLEIFQHKHHMLAKGFDAKKDKIVFDAGANEGYYTIGMKQNNPSLKIISVEPVPETFKMLKKNINTNKLKNIIPINKALSFSNKKISMDFVPEATMIASKNILAQPRSWLDKKRIKKVKVQGITLTKLCKQLKINSIDILKLDVEGAELDILKGGKEMLPKIKKIIIEWHSKKLKKQCTQLLQKNGFKLVLSSNEHMCGDIYFVNRKFR